MFCIIYDEEQRNEQKNKNESLWGCHLASGNIWILTKDGEEKLRSERKIYGPKRIVEGVYQRLTNLVFEELKGPGKVARRRHCESYKDTEVVLVQPYKDEKKKY